jgi:hypothetical protein
MYGENVCNSVVEFSAHISFSDFDNFSILIAFCRLLFLPQHVLKIKFVIPKMSWFGRDMLFCVINIEYLCVDGFCLDSCYKEHNGMTHFNPLKTKCICFI